MQIPRSFRFKIFVGGLVCLAVACGSSDDARDLTEPPAPASFATTTAAAPAATEAPTPATPTAAAPTTEPAVSLTGASVPSSTTTTSQIAAGTDGEVVRYSADDDPDHRMIVFLPPGEGPFPAMVLIHGGGWRTGVPEQMAAIARVYVRQGVAAFSLGYQLSTPDEPSWPTNVQDVVCAVRHIRANAEFYGIDPDRIGAHGVSAGAHLAGMLGTIDGDAPFLDGACGDPAAGHAVVFVASYMGPLNLEFMGEAGVGAQFQVTQFLGATFAEDPQLWRDASPHSYVDSQDPPFLIAHGSADGTVPVGSATSFAELLEAAGGEAHLVIVEGVDHGEPLPDANPVRLMLIARLLRS